MIIYKDAALKRSNKRVLESRTATSWDKCKQCSTPIAPNNTGKPCHYCKLLKQAKKG